MIAPKARIAALSNDDASVRDVLRIATELELSMEAAARRYVELHPNKIAVVFTLNGDVKYSAKSSSSPQLAARKGDRFLTAPARKPCETSYEEIDVDLSSVSGQSKSVIAGAETYYQQAGHAFTILNFEREPEVEDEGDGEEDAFERISRYNK